MNALRIVMLALFLPIAGTAMAVESKGVDPQAFVARAVFLQDRLWLLTDFGELSSIAEADERRMAEAIPDPVSDICAHEGKLLAVTCKRSGCEEWSLRRFDQGTWSVEATIPVRGERLLAFACGGPSVSFLTDRRLIDLKREEQRSVRLSQPLNVGPVAAVLETPKGLYVGFNVGEWGGGLRLVDRLSGKVTTIEKNASGELCDGPLNTDCDPVTGIVRSPWNTQCIAAAIGLVHFFSHGRILEICGTTVRTLYSKKLPRPGTDDAKPGAADKPDSDGLRPTVAFFGLMRAGNSLWASGIDGLYKIEEDGSANIIPLPELKEIGGVYVSFERPDIIFVLTEVNQRRSLSGAVPLIVPRNP